VVNHDVDQTLTGRFGVARWPVAAERETACIRGGISDDTGGPILANSPGLLRAGKVGGLALAAVIVPRHGSYRRCFRPYLGPNPRASKTGDSVCKGQATSEAGFRPLRSPLVRARKTGSQLATIW
jgi:hypothetical protein